MIIELKDIPIDIRVEVTHYLPERKSTNRDDPNDPMELEYNIYIVGKDEIEIDINKLKDGDREVIEEMIYKELEYSDSH
jgi:hypothetical protein